MDNALEFLNGNDYLDVLVFLRFLEDAKIIDIKEDRPSILSGVLDKWSEAEN